MTRMFALCRGAGLDICDTCSRCMDNQPEAASEATQAWIQPANGPHCGYYLGDHRIAAKATSAYNHGNAE